MKITKAKYNWLVAQYNYRKNKEEIIEISNEEYERLTNNSSIIDDEIIDINTIYIKNIIIQYQGNEQELTLDTNINLFSGDLYTYTSNTSLLSFSTLDRIYAKYNNDTYKEITPQIKYYLDKNIGTLERSRIKQLTYYPPEFIDEDIVNVQIIGEYNGHKFNAGYIKLYDKEYFFNTYAKIYMGNVYLSGPDAYYDNVPITLTIKSNNKCDLIFSGSSFHTTYNNCNITNINNELIIYQTDVNDYIIKFIHYYCDIKYIRGDMMFGPNIILPMIDYIPGGYIYNNVELKSNE